MEITQYFDDITFWFVVLLIIVFLIYFLPSYIGYKKHHKYRWIIFVINLIFGSVGIGWLIAFIWAVWPQKSSLIDPIADPSGAGGMAKEFGERASTFNQYANTNRTSRINYCEKCGDQLVVNAKFCRKCGHKLN